MADAIGTTVGLTRSRERSSVIALCVTFSVYLLPAAAGVGCVLARIAHLAYQHYPFTLLLLVSEVFDRLVRVWVMGGLACLIFIVVLSLYLWCVVPLARTAYCWCLLYLRLGNMAVYRAHYQAHTLFRRVSAQ